MFTAGSATGGTHPQEERPEVTDKITLAKLLHGLATVYEKLLNLAVGIEARRYQDPRDQDPDYGRRLRELEGQIEQIDREQQGFRMGDYHEGGDKKSWKDWILGLLALVIIGWLARLDVKIDDISDLKAQAKQMEKRQDQTDKHLESTDTHVERIENKVYRGVP